MVLRANEMHSKNLVEKISEILETGTQDCPFVSGQVGVETASSDLISKYMKGKVKPFKPNEWKDVVIQGNKILADNNWIPIETLIMGLPGETASDVRKTIDLLDDLSQYKSLIVPLFFVPIGNLKDKEFFNKNKCMPEHWELLAQSIKHTLKWSYRILDEEPLNEINGIKKWIVKRVIKIMERKMSSYLKLMENGVSPLGNKKSN